MVRLKRYLAFFIFLLLFLSGTAALGVPTVAARAFAPAERFLVVRGDVNRTAVSSAEQTTISRKLPPHGNSIYLFKLTVVKGVQNVDLTKDKQSLFRNDAQHTGEQIRPAGPDRFQLSNFYSFFSKKYLGRYYTVGLRKIVV